MPRGSASIEIPASCAEVFALVHDYDRRLQWDTMLSEARLLGGAPTADVGVRSVCVGKWSSAYMAVETEYVSFSPGEVAAVKLTNRPLIFDKFAASIRHAPLTESTSRLTYVYSFEARPRFLAFVLNPIMALLLGWEVRSRLRGLRAFFERAERAGLA